MSKSWGLTILRLVVGIVFAVHGGQKLFQLGIGGVTGFFTMAHIPMPSVAAPVVTFVEFLGGIALILGVGTRWAALLIAGDMLGAIVFVHGRNGFYMQNQGYEYVLTLLAATLALAIAGPGAAAVDGLLGKGK